MSQHQGVNAQLPTLTLSLKGAYFEAIRDGSKHEEYRLAKPCWAKRLEGRSYAQIMLTLGYPAIDDHQRRLVLPWRGFTRKTITHPHFGPDPVDVYAIDVSAKPLSTEEQKSRPNPVGL